MSAIKEVVGRKIYDSRGNPTLEVDILLEGGARGRASVPSGASTGISEVFKFGDIEKSVANVEALKKNLVGQEAQEQEKIDLLMINLDGTKQKKNIGGNVIMAVSLAICEAAAIEAGMPLFKYINKISGIKLDKYSLPIPMFNIINGGKHADSGLSIQEFMIVPFLPGTYKERFEAGVKVYHQLKEDLRKRNLATSVGDEGGFAPTLTTNEEAMELIVGAITNAGFNPDHDMKLALDVAASSIPDLNAVTYPLDPISFYEKIVNEYPISIIEDPLNEADWNGWQEITQRIGDKIKIVGDDIFTTNSELLKKGIDMKAGNSILVKPDQIGTLTETLQTIKLAIANKFDVAISHRSGETESTFISDLAVGVGAQYIKTGAPSRGERMAKYNQLLRIEEELIK